jgi:hypothetical protein
MSEIKTPEAIANDVWGVYHGGLMSFENVIRNVVEDERSRLTALERKLEEARKWMRHNPACAVYATPIGLPCDCGLDAFLSTLEGEKKDHTPECAVLIAVSKPYRGDVPGCDCGLDSTKKDPSK